MTDLSAAPPAKLVYDSIDILAAPAPPLVPLLSPVLEAGRLLLIRGEQGLGKSWVALTLAHAVAAGIPAILPKSVEQAAAPPPAAAAVPALALAAPLVVGAGLRPAPTTICTGAILSETVEQPPPEVEDWPLDRLLAILAARWRAQKQNRPPPADPLAHVGYTDLFYRIRARHGAKPINAAIRADCRRHGERPP